MTQGLDGYVTGSCLFCDVEATITLRSRAQRGYARLCGPCFRKADRLAHTFGSEMSNWYGTTEPDPKGEVFEEGAAAQPLREPLSETAPEDAVKAAMELLRLRYKKEHANGSDTDSDTAEVAPPEGDSPDTNDDTPWALIF